MKRPFAARAVLSALLGVGLAAGAATQPPES